MLRANRPFPAFFVNVLQQRNRWCQTKPEVSTERLPCGYRSCCRYCRTEMIGCGMVRDCMVGDMRIRTPLTNYRVTFSGVAVERQSRKLGRCP